MLGWCNGKVIKTRCGEARAGLAGEKKAGPVMDVPRFHCDTTMQRLNDSFIAQRYCPISGKP
jgi:hypothetical protein